MAELLPERVEVIEQVRKVVLASLPEGVVESINYGMIAYEIPLERYPDTYNKQPLMYAALAANKNSFSLHLHGVYASTEVEQQLRDAYGAEEKQLDMGKSCVRFKRIDQLVPSAIAASMASVSVDDFIELYEASRAAETRPGQRG